MISSARGRFWYSLAHLRGLLRYVKASFGGRPRECIVCGFQGKFLSFGMPPRFDARCSNCGSLERHRLFVLMLMRNKIIEGKDVIHFAPEPGLTEWLRGRGPATYRTADLFRPADLKLNLEELDLSDACCDVMICSHVLEHVDDRKALSEITRVLRPGGTAIVMIPIVEGWEQTYEDAAIKSNEGRLHHFGQEDHVRFYGRDFRDRVAAAGLRLTEFTATEPDVQRFGLMRGEKVFLCHKPSIDTKAGL